MRETVTRRARVEDAELDGWIVAGADAAAIERRESLQRILRATRASHLLARELYDRRLPNLLVLYLEGTDEIGHVFGGYAPPKLSCVSEADAARYGGIVARYYALVDSLLGQWMRRAKEGGATLLVHSDHGFKWGTERPCEFASKDAATAAFWHRPHGVFAVWGGSTRKAAGRAEASILDVAPTVLSLLDLPSDPRMPGKPLEAAFTALPSPERKAWLAETPVRRLAVDEMSPEEAGEYVRKLIALGYDVTIEGREVLDGRSAVIVAFSPRPGVKASNLAGKILQKFAGRAWVDEEDYQVVRAEAELLDTLTYGVGIFARLYKGASASFVRRKVNGDVWLPARARFRGHARLLLVKGLRIDSESEYTDYRKFQVATDEKIEPEAASP